MARRALDPGATIGGYVVERQLGAGGSGQVYLVRDGEGLPAALKRVDAQHDEVAAERLRREVRALMAIRHPAVPRVRDAELDDDETFVVFEFIEGESLAVEVAEQGPARGRGPRLLCGAHRRRAWRRPTRPGWCTAMSRRPT